MGRGMGRGRPGHPAWTAATSCEDEDILPPFLPYPED